MPKKLANRRPHPDLRFSLQRAAPMTDMPHHATVRRWVRAALETDAEITVRLVGPEEARTLNQNFRGGDYVPNVLSFSYGEAKAGPIHGDIVVCPQKVQEEAAAFGLTQMQRFAHMVVHGTLHLQGYDHATTAEAQSMEARETAILAALGFGDPYQGAPAPLTQSAQT